MMHRITGLLAASMLLLTITPSLHSYASANDDVGIRFDVYLDDKKIGTHHFDRQSSEGVETIRSVAKFKYTVLLIPAFRYEHLNEERWSGGCLLDFNARTRTNGKKVEVSGAREANTFLVERAGATSELPECVMTFAYWNPQFLEQQQLLNQQTGEYVDVDIREVGIEKLRVGNEWIAASKFELVSPDAELTLWYSPSMEWLALESVARGDRVIRYVRT